MSSMSFRMKSTATRLLSALTLLVGLGLSGCSTVNVDKLADAGALPLIDTPEALQEAAYRIRPGDDLDVKFTYTAELNETQKVRPDGFISLPLVDEVLAAGRTPKELRTDLSSLYKGKVRQSELQVILRSFAGHRAYVGGEVGVPQVVSLEGGLSALQAVQRVGGARTTAAKDQVLLVRKGPQGQPIAYRLDLSEQHLSGGGRDALVALKASDILILPRSRIANANLFVQQYIGDLLMFRGLNFGYTVTEQHNRESTTNIRNID